jgi:CheY-like chemotaxis protein
LAGGPIVLLVHSERDDRDAYGEYLRQLGFTPWCVREAIEALRLASRVDIIVTGLLLTGTLDGCALIDALRRNPATRAIPIVVLTVCAWEEEEGRARRAGCDGFLSKPCPPFVLSREIRRMLAARAAIPVDCACS